MVKGYRVDATIPVDIRDDIKIIQYIMNKDKEEEEKKVTMDNIMRTIVDEYMDSHPNIKKIKEQDKYIIQRLEIKEMLDRKNGINIANGDDEYN
jgi:hypothetical protein